MTHNGGEVNPVSPVERIHSCNYFNPITNNGAENDDDMESAENPRET